MPLYSIKDFEPCQHDTWTIGCKGCIRRVSDRIAELEAENKRLLLSTQPTPTELGEKLLWALKFDQEPYTLAQVEDALKNLPLVAALSEAGSPEEAESGEAGT